MKLYYKIHIHRYPDKKKNDETILVTSWKSKDSEYHTNQIEYCCPRMNEAIKYGYITIATLKRNYSHIPYENRAESLAVPKVCLVTFNEDNWNHDSSPVKYNMPISHCPFCGESITVQCVEKKKITHTCKKVKTTVKECEDQTKEEIIMSKDIQILENSN